FFDGGSILGTALVDASGQATLPTSFTTTGSHTIRAAYSGDGDFAASARALTERVKSSSQLALVASANPVPTGQPVTLTATVSPASGTGTPTGTVTFMDGNVVLARVTLSSGQATLVTSFATAGRHTLKAVYSGDGNFFGSAKSLFEQVN